MLYKNVGTRLRLLTRGGHVFLLAISPLPEERPRRGQDAADGHDRGGQAQPIARERWARRSHRADASARSMACAMMSRLLPAVWCVAYVLRILAVRFMHHCFIAGETSNGLGPKVVRAEHHVSRIRRSCCISQRMSRGISTFGMSSAQTMRAIRATTEQPGLHKTLATAPTDQCSGKAAVPYTTMEKLSDRTM